MQQAKDLRWSCVSGRVNCTILGNKKARKKKWANIVESFYNNSTSKTLPLPPWGMQALSMMHGPPLAYFGHGYDSQLV